MSDRPGAAGHSLPISTTFEITGHKTEQVIGACFGLVVRSMGFSRSFTAQLTALKKGEVHQYTELLEDSRRHAVDRMVENAHLMGANAIIGMRFDSSEIGTSLTEIVAYGTAVVISA